MLLKQASRVLLVVSIAVSAMACDEGSGGDDELPDVTIPKDELDEWEVFRFSSLQEPYDTEKECIAHNDKEHGDTSDLTACRCNNCLDLMQECDALQGCVEIRACAQESGCNSEFSCYLFPLAPCTEVIDEWGNAGVATAVSVELMQCSMAAGCD